MLKKNKVYAPTAMIRKSVFKKNGLLPTHFLHEDYYLWLKILSSGGKIYNTNKMWAHYRLESNLSERKINWYFKGSYQVLMEYASNKHFSASLSSHLRNYLIKLSLLLGKEILKKYKKEMNQSNWYIRILVCSIAFSPNFIRNKLAKYLKISA